MGDVTLTAAVRSSLLSLKNTQNLVERTQDRLSTGLAVENAIDDAIKYFQAKSLNNRGFDLLNYKDDVDQGVSSIAAGLDGVTAIEAIVNQMKGITNSMKSATAAQMSELTSTFNELHTQINNVAADSIYKGLNLINGTGSTLIVEFTEKTASRLSVASVDLRATDSRTAIGSTRLGLQLTNVASYTQTDLFSLQGGLTGLGAASVTTAGTIGNRYLTTTSDFNVTWNATDKTFLAGETIDFTYGTGQSMSLVVKTATPVTVTNGGTFDIDIVSAASSFTWSGTADMYHVGTSSTNLVVMYAEQLMTGGVYSAANATLIGTAVTSKFIFTYGGNNTITLTTADGSVFLGSGGTAATYDEINLQVTSGNSLVLTEDAVITVETFSAIEGAMAFNTGGGFIVHTGLTGSGMNFTASTSSTASTLDAKMGFRIGGPGAAIGEITGVTGASMNLNNTSTGIKTGIVTAGNTTEINKVIAELDAALVTLRTKAQTMGTNVALLSTRIDFTEDYVSTLQEGADKLTLADINEEGANLLALQTRQQLGIQALSLAAQAEASILRLFG